MCALFGSDLSAAPFMECMTVSTSHTYAWGLGRARSLKTSLVRAWRHWDGADGQRAALNAVGGWSVLSRCGSETCGVLAECNAGSGHPHARRVMRARFEQFKCSASHAHKLVHDLPSPSRAPPCKPGLQRAAAPEPGGA